MTRALCQRGFSRVRILKGGLGACTNARLPVEAKSHLPSISIEIYKNRVYIARVKILLEKNDAGGRAKPTKRKLARTA